MKLWITLICTLLTCSAFAINDGGDVVVVYNSTMPESKDVAEHYASMRNVPTTQVIGLATAKTESMSRAQYREQVQEPLLKQLEKQNLLTFKNSKVVDAKIRYVVLCYGIPLKIEQASISEKIDPKLEGELRKNSAGVDSELANLPRIYENLPLAGPLGNPAFHATNSAAFNPTNGLLMVARLDGPTAEIARALVDKAVQAERDGLWGRAYVDARGITNKSPYAQTDTNFLIAAEAAQRTGFDTVIDKNYAPFSKAFPMSQIALFAGWANENLTGPFTNPKVEFMPGAVAYPLQSYDAATLRSETEHWAGPLLAKGVTATMGAVDEPLLGGLPDPAIFFTRWLMLHMTFGESAYSSLAAISWQGVVVGDPLYQPFRKDPQKLHQELANRGSKLVEWSHLKVVDLNAAMGTPLPQLIQYLKDEPATKSSAVLSEKLGDLYQAEGKTELSLEQYRQALKLNPSPQQEVRLRLLIMNKLVALGKRDEVPAEFEQFQKHCPKYPEMDLLEQQVKRATSAPAPKP